MFSMSCRLGRDLRLLLILLALAAGGFACSSGVSNEEFEAVQQDLQAEREQSQSLGSQLTQEKANVANLQESLDKAEAREALLAVLLAWNRKDTEGFIAGFTDVGISDLPRA